MTRLSSDLRDYVQVYDDFLPPALCQRLLVQFEATPDRQDIELQTAGGPGHFKQITLAEAPGWAPVSESLTPIFIQAAQRYHADVGKPLFPKRPALEQFRLKRYLPDGRDAFPLHIDAADKDSATRFLVMFAYLNDVEAGGETTFPDFDLSIRPKAGRLLCFPPMWMFPHTGEPPRSGPKYLLGTYLHFT